MNARHETSESSRLVRIEIPEWDLRDLYLGSDDPAIDRDLVSAEILSRNFVNRYRGCLVTLDDKEFASAIGAYEVINEALFRITSFADLIFAVNTDDGDVAKFWQNIHERATSVSTRMLFFELEINEIEDTSFDKLLNYPAIIRYKPWLDFVRCFRAYQLSYDQEEILHKKMVVGRKAWCRLFDQTMEGLRFNIGGRYLTCGDVLSRLSDKDVQIRKEAAEAFGKGLEDNIQLFSLIINVVVKDKEIEDGWRGLPRSVSAQNLQNQVEDEVVDALSSAVQASYPQLSHRYYKLKAKWMGVEYLNHWDRNAPLPESGTTQISWEQSKNIVLSSYNDFEPRMGEIAKEFFDNNWIDARPRKGKNSGAFCSPTVPSANPYILMNYYGRPNDVMTLAHELGHGIHQMLAASQGYLLSKAPLTLAETASVFGEMLTFQTLLKTSTDRLHRKVLLASKVEDMLNTVVRQIAFYEFEEKVHSERKQGELTSDRLGELWISVQKKSLGPVFRYEKDYRHFWAYIPHFIHFPFYVYSYAFGICLVNSLYDRFLQDGSDFTYNYVKMLQAGGSIRYAELLDCFGLDASDPGFWNRGLSMIKSLIDELEENY